MLQRIALHAHEPRRIRVGRLGFTLATLHFDASERAASPIVKASSRCGLEGLFSVRIQRGVKTPHTRRAGALRPRVLRPLLHLPSPVACPARLARTAQGSGSACHRDELERRPSCLVQDRPRRSRRAGAPGRWCRPRRARPWRWRTRSRDDAVEAITTASRDRVASATLRNAAGETIGRVRMRGVTTTARFESLFVSTPGARVHGFHVHTTGRCDAPAFTTAAGTSTRLARPTTPMPATCRPARPGRRDGQLADRHGSLLDRRLRDADGSAVMVHSGPDNFANIPPRYGTPDQNARHRRLRHAGRVRSRR